MRNLGFVFLTVAVTLIGVPSANAEIRSPTRSVQPEGRQTVDRPVLVPQITHLTVALPLTNLREDTVVKELSNIPFRSGRTGTVIVNARGYCNVIRGQAKEIDLELRRQTETPMSTPFANWGVIRVNPAGNYVWEDAVMWSAHYEFRTVVGTNHRVVLAARETVPTPRMTDSCAGTISIDIVP